MADGKLTLDEQLCFALYAATNAVTRAYRPRLAQIGLTYPQYLVMLVLWQDGPRIGRELAERLSLPASALTPLIDRLENSGLVVRERDNDDRRIVRVALTQTGRELEAMAADAQQEVVCETGLSPDRLDLLRDELKLLVRRMELEQAAAPRTEAGLNGPGTAITR